MMLLVSAGLLLKDFSALRSLDIGVRRDGVWTAAVQLPQASYKTDRQRYDFSQTLMERARRVGGVDSVALSDHLPLEGGSNYYVKLRGQTGAMSNQLVERHSASPEYFRAIGVRLLQGVYSRRLTSRRPSSTICASTRSGRPALSHPRI